MSSVARLLSLWTVRQVGKLHSVAWWVRNTVGMGQYEHG
jgi:hypothetical protein